MGQLVTVPPEFLRCLRNRAVHSLGIGDKGQLANIELVKVSNESLIDGDRLFDLRTHPVDPLAAPQLDQGQKFASLRLPQAFNQDTVTRFVL